ncbi:MAG: CvpA family protein [Bacteriovoracaceae bacterium]|nr:CvpA family protein [Bacteroidota bacterium]
MAVIDIILGVIILIFMYSGFKSGFIKKIIGFACLVLALILGTKYAADVNELIFAEMGISGTTGFFVSFVMIVVAITLTQSILYKIFIQDLVDSMWNNVFGMFVGIVEGALVVSIALIVMSIYLDLPSQETKAESELYKPIKNFSPMVFDQINTLLPESEDFYQQIMNFTNGEKPKKK